MVSVIAASSGSGFATAAIFGPCSSTARPVPAPVPQPRLPAPVATPTNTSNFDDLLSDVDDIMANFEAEFKF